MNSANSVIKVRDWLLKCEQVDDEVALYCWDGQQYRPIPLCGQGAELDLAAWFLSISTDFVLQIYPVDGSPMRESFPMSPIHAQKTLETAVRHGQCCWGAIHVRVLDPQGEPLALVQVAHVSASDKTIRWEGGFFLPPLNSL